VLNAAGLRDGRPFGDRRLDVGDAYRRAIVGRTGIEAMEHGVPDRVNASASCRSLTDGPLLVEKRRSLSFIAAIAPVAVQTMRRE
jgi:hypothetical protein